MQTQRKANNVNIHRDSDNDMFYNSSNNKDVVDINQFDDDLYDYKDYFLSENPNEDYGEDEDDDDNGPLAIRANPSTMNHQDENFYGQYYNDDENCINEEDEDDGDGLTTFFKKVDSIDLIKPKKVKIIANYLFGDLLGDGSYGKVKECLDTRNLCRRAVKIINLKIVSRKIPKGIQNVRKEISIMKKLNHKNVIKLYDVFEKNTNNLNTHHNKEMSHDDPDGLVNIVYEKPPKVYIFMDYCMTSLEKLLKCAPQERLCNWQAHYYFRQLIDGLEYLHSIGIIHNDIKPGNLLITCDNTLKICDFSVSADMRLFNDYDLTSNSNDEPYDLYLNEHSLTQQHNPHSFPLAQCTPMFQCPEMLAEIMDEKMLILNANKIDIWSTGVSLYQLTSGILPFQGTTVHQIYENIRSTSYDIKIPEFIDKNLNRLLNGMLNRDPIQRWSIQQIRECEWFKKKHPFVFDEIANWPNDVLQNETSTFRMLQFVEKLCNGEDNIIINNDGHSKSNQMSIQQQQQQQSNNQTDENFVTARSYQDTLIGNNNNNESHQNNDVTTNNVNNQYNKTGHKTVNNGTMPKQYAQATKVKRNNCTIN